MDASYLSQQVNSIIGQLHGLFDEIGVPSHDRDNREAEVRDYRATKHIATFGKANKSDVLALRCSFRNVK